MTGVQTCALPILTVYYPDTASPIFTGSFLIHDSDLPDVSITPPTANSGTIPIEVGADDTGNYIDPGIDAIQLYIDGIDVQNWISPAAIPVTFDWVTESGGQIFWLNGQHTVYARATTHLPDDGRPRSDEWCDTKIKRLAPLGRLVDPKEIGSLAVFLASEHARNITGQALNVDGGWVMHS